MPFSQAAAIENNAALREPQREAWQAIRTHFSNPDAQREVGIVLPVGCGKSGLITITPFAVQARRVLVIAPGVRIREQLARDFSSAHDANFYERFNVLRGGDRFPELAVIEGDRTNFDDIEHANVIVTNIQQIQGNENRWLTNLPPDSFDLILVDEAHHNTAESWNRVRQSFPPARIVNYSATPRRADGRVMEGTVIYSYAVVRAIRAGFVKRLRAKMLNPARLRYVDRADGVERTITADEVRRLGGEDAAFRRGIVMSPETLNSIVDCAINELERVRRETGEPRLKIIASALSQQHCIQIVQAFRERGRRAEFVHSLESQEANRRVFQALEHHELDAIVQARMLGEGFDHPYLSVAMVGSIFSSLSPFVQFVGRVMRALRSGEPAHPLNQGVVVFHAGSNAAQRWEDFREFSQADQEFFDQLLPLEEDIDFAGNEMIDREPGGGGGLAPVEVLEAEQINVEDLPLVDDPEIRAALDFLAARGITAEQAAQELRRRTPQRQDRRRALREGLPDRVKNAVGRILHRRGMNPRGRTLDRSRRRTNLEFLVAAVNRRIAASVGRELGDRPNYTLDELEQIYRAFDDLVADTEREVFGG